ncbi:hypothetical protein [Nocardia sp. MW-W600-9]
MTTVLARTGGDDVQEWATILGSIVGGGVITELMRAVTGRRGQRVDNVVKLERLATSIAEKATAAADARAASADARVAQMESRVGDLEAQAARRRVAAVAHSQWDEQLVAKLRELGVAVSPPPPLEVV